MNSITFFSKYEIDDLLLFILEHIDTTFLNRLSQNHKKLWNPN